MRLAFSVAVSAALLVQTPHIASAGTRSMVELASAVGTGDGLTPSDLRNRRADADLAGVHLKLKSPPHHGAEVLKRYCIGVIRSAQSGRSLERSAEYRPNDCRMLFVKTAQANQAGRGGDGAGFPGLPGGRGGEPGGPAPRRSGGEAEGPDLSAVDPDLTDYCVGVLQHRGRMPLGDYGPADCAYYFLTLDHMAAAGRGPGARARGPSGRDGPDGPSIAGGIGGRGGAGGAGAFGGRGGAGGAGVGGGMGGAGGAGGASD